MLFQDFSYNLLRNDRIGIVGPNGSGKSTLLNLLAGRLQPDCGTITIGETVRIGYFSQMSEELDPQKRVIDIITDISDSIETTEGICTASQMCEKFLFDAKAQWSQVSRLSGGEKRRLYLLSILMAKPNVLFFDEPTNDLDIETLTILEEFLETFNGALITISHDRYFLDKVVDKIFAFENGSIRSYPGGYTDYEEKRQPLEKKEKEKGVRVRSAIPQMTSKEKKEFEGIDQRLEEIGEELKQIDEEIAEHANDFAMLQTLSQKRDSVEALQAETEERWLYLNDLYQKIQDFKQGKF